MLWKTKTTFQFAHFDEWYFRRIADPRFFNNFSALLHPKTWILKVYKQWMNVQCAWLWYKTKRKYGHEINDFFLLKFTRMIKKYFPSNSIFLRPIFLTNKKSALITETFLELLTPWNWALTTWYLSRCVNLYFKKKGLLKLFMKATTQKFILPIVKHMQMKEEGHCLVVSFYAKSIVFAARFYSMTRVFGCLLKTKMTQ